MNTFENYYIYQAGSGITGFSGYRYQKGDGFFGRLISGTLLPLLKKSLGFLGRNALEAGVNIGSDLLTNDNINVNTIKKVAKKRGLEQSKMMAKKALQKVLTDQSGSGRKRKYRRRRKKQKNLNIVKSIKGNKKSFREKRRYSKKRVNKLKLKDFLSK